jgi:nitroreductase
MDTWLAIASRREVRDYRPDPLPEDVVRRILEAGRVSGSSKNHQPWRFVVVHSRELLDRLAATLRQRGNLATAPLFVAVLADDHPRAAFDGGRAVQNMLLTAWNDDVGGCPNGFADEEAARELLGVRPEQQLLVGLTFGFPARRRDPTRKRPEQWTAGADRLPLDELVQAWL